MMDARALAGHWRRDWLRAPGLEDRTTRVDWLQSPCGAYVDLRRPAALPPPPPRLADLSPAGHAAWLACEGFAGTIALAGDVCTWTRAINLHGRPAAPDTGRLAPMGGPDRMLEAGVHADYTELWTRQPDDPPRARRFAGEGVVLHLLWTRHRFAFGIGRPGKPATGRLRAAAARGEAAPEALAAHYADEYAIGRWEGAAAVIEGSTHPLRRPGPVFDRRALDGTLILPQPRADGITVLRRFEAAPARPSGAPAGAPGASRVIPLA